MKDRFKFRVWSEEDCGYMESNDIFRLTHSGKLVFNNDSLNREPECNPKKYILEECTGLKDKNGKPIYEGDFLKDHNGIWQVLWNEKEAAFYLYNKKRDFYLSPFIGEFEVIGNIHEKEEQ